MFDKSKSYMCGGTEVFIVREYSNRTNVLIKAGRVVVPKLVHPIYDYAACKRVELENRTFYLVAEEDIEDYPTEATINALNKYLTGGVKHTVSSNAAEFIAQPKEQTCSDSRVTLNTALLFPVNSQCLSFIPGDWTIYTVLGHKEDQVLVSIPGETVETKWFSRNSLQLIVKAVPSELYIAGPIIDDTVTDRVKARFPIGCKVKSALSNSATRYHVTGYEKDRILVQPIKKDYNVERCRYAYKPIELERV